MKKLKVAY